MYTLIEDRSSWQDEIASLLLGYVRSVTTVRGEYVDDLFPNLAAKTLLEADSAVKHIGYSESYALTGGMSHGDFQDHSKAAVGNYDSLLIYSYCHNNECWEIEETTPQSQWHDPDWMMTDGVIDRAKSYHSMVVPVINGVPDYSRWSFAPDWAGYPRVCNDYLEEEKYDDIVPSVRGKRKAVEKKRGFRGNPNMRMAA